MRRLLLFPLLPISCIIQLTNFARCLLSTQIVVRGQRETHFLPAELRAHASPMVLTRRDDVGILVVELTLIHFTVVYVEAGAYLPDCALVASFYVVRGQVLDFTFVASIQSN